MTLGYFSALLRCLPKGLTWIAPRPPLYLSLSLAQVIYITREMYRGFSARHMTRTAAPGADKGLTRSVANLTLTRWDCARPPTVDNVVMLTFEEADRHDEVGDHGQLRVAEPQFARWVDAILDLARRQYFY